MCNAFPSSRLTSFCHSHNFSFLRKMKTPHLSERSRLLATESIKKFGEYKPQKEKNN